MYSQFSSRLISPDAFLRLKLALCRLAASLAAFARAFFISSTRVTSNNTVRVGPEILNRVGPSLRDRGKLTFRFSDKRSFAFEAPISGWAVRGADGCSVS